MSAYGKIATPQRTTPALSPRAYPLGERAHQEYGTHSGLVVFPVTLATCPPALVLHLSTIFNDVVREGRTYPQEKELSLGEFEAYFLGGYCFVGLISSVDISSVDVGLEGFDLESERWPSTGIAPYLNGENLTDCVGGMFYVKPNYPGRSSHNCNGGFVVPPRHGGRGIGKTLGRAYLHFAPLLGYKASVFNLVYTSNIPSTKIWDSLGFNRVGLIPNAGRLKSRDEDGEDEWCDAIVYHKTF